MTSTNSQTNKDVCIKIVAARMKFEEQIAKYDLECKNAKKLQVTYKTKFEKLYQSSGITDPIIFPPGHKLKPPKPTPSPTSPETKPPKKAKPQETRVFIGYITGNKMCEVTSEILESAINDIKIDDILEIVKCLQNKQKKILDKEKRAQSVVPKGQRYKGEKIDPTKLDVSASEVLAELVGKKIMDFRKCPVRKLKIDDVAKVPKNFVALDDLDNELRTACIEFYHSTKEKKRLALLKKRDKQALVEWEKKYNVQQQLCSDFKFPAQINNKTVEIQKTFTNKKHKISKKIIVLETSKLFHTAFPKYGNTFNHTMAKEWVQSQSFKTKLVSELTKSISQWIKTSSVEKVPDIKFTELNNNKNK